VVKGRQARRRVRRRDHAIGGGSRGGGHRDRYVTNVHWGAYGPAREHAGGSGAPAPAAAPLQGAWHVYALEWTQTAYRFLLDGVAQGATKAGVARRPEFLRLTYEVQDGSWAGPVPAGGYGSRETSGTRMDVDWVRVWQRGPEGGR